MNYTSLIRYRILLSILSVLIFFVAEAQEILPPVLPWKGKSLALISKKDSQWITPAEKTDFDSTPSYTETMNWLDKLCKSGSTMKMISIGKSAQSRDINMIIISADKNFDKEALRKSPKPILLVQAGIHAGEIDGKDAGMMLLRDLAYGKKNELLQNVNILFIPILNVDGHERSSIYNRVNQRGPTNMGWRTNARNLNLNRDYTKLDTEEIRAVVNVLNDYDPSLYLDLHVTDGADYQYDITYGFSASYSSESGKWLKEKLNPAVDTHLKNYGHIPGPLMFAANNRDFTNGNIEYPFQPRFSNTYGDLRHVPSILVENHSLKPYEQRVLGTYVFLEGVLNILNKDGAGLKKAIEADRRFRAESVIISWKQASKPDSMLLLGIESTIKKSEVTNKDYVVWLGRTVNSKVPYLKYNQPDKSVKRPKAYWIPGTYKNVIDILKLHGIAVQQITEAKELELKEYRIEKYKFAAEPFEGHISVTASVRTERSKRTFYPGSVKVETDQPLGDLLIHLMEPESEDSFFSWGYFYEIFNRTEYIEEYAIEPLAKKMLAADEKLRAEFENKKKTDPKFADDSQAVYEWFYAKSPYVDKDWLLYPVGIEE
jgi:hypothetical protein